MNKKVARVRGLWPGHRSESVLAINNFGITGEKKSNMGATGVREKLRQYRGEPAQVKSGEGASPAGASTKRKRGSSTKGGGGRMLGGKRRKSQLSA